MPKNIVVLSDGTGQEGGKGQNTNVYKLFNMVLDRSPQQIAFYDRGLGTGWRKLSGSVAGMGISKNILECYRFIFDHYEAGDDVFLIGFSRGATTVRSLSSFIHLFGVLPKSRPELIEQAYKIYKKGRKRREKAAKAFLAKHHKMWCRIKFLGVWDTVAALGLPFKSIDVVLDKIWFLRHKYQDLTLSESVKHAYQALALDEERRVFKPVFWDTTLKKEDQTMSQVWFCGMHSDVGGGYAEQGISDIALEWMVGKALEWMVGKAASHGLEIYPHHEVTISGEADGRMHDSRGTVLTGLYRRKVRSWNTKTHGKPVVHESVLKRTRNRHNLSEPTYRPWILDGSYEYEVEPWKRV